MGFAGCEVGTLVDRNRSLDRYILDRSKDMLIRGGENIYRFLRPSHAI